MKIMKRIAAAAAALAASIGFGIAPAMADGYGADVTVEGSTATATVTFDPQEIAQYGEYVYVEADEDLVSAVIPAATIDDPAAYYAGHVTKENPTATFTFKLTKEATCKGGELAYNVYLGKNKVSGNNGGELTSAQVHDAELSKVLYSGSVKIAATGECAASEVLPNTNNGSTDKQNPKTGAAVMPYAIVAALLAAAAVAMFVVRKQSKR